MITKIGTYIAGALLGLLIGMPTVRADLVFEVTNQTVAATWPYQQVVGMYKFTNTGSQTVKITDLQSSCRCTVPKLDKREYAPGESGELQAVFTVGDQRGSQHKIITLTTDQPSQPTAQVTLDTDIPDVPGLSRLLLYWHTGTELAPQTVDVTLPADVPLDKVEVDAGTIPFTVVLKTIEDGKHYQVVVTPTSTAGKFQNTDVKVIVKLKDGTTRARTFQVIIS
jgi:hypothetical protein